MSDRNTTLGPPPYLAYAGSRLDRAAERRSDAEFVARAYTRSDARTYVISGERIVLAQKNGKLDPLFAPADAMKLGPSPETILIGLDGEAAHFAHALAAADAAKLEGDADFLVSDLRTVAMKALVSDDLLGPIAAAKALMAWHARHRFCSNCGAPTRNSEAGWRRDCGACSAQHFPRTDPCVIMLAIDKDNCLLGRSARFPGNMWSCLAGFIEPGESVEDAVRRETFEEAGVTVGRVRYFASQPWPFPMSLMIGCHAEASSVHLKIDRNELEDGRWFTRAEAAQMLARKHPNDLFVPPPIAIAHHLIRAYVERGAAVLSE
jgi:NAD+ diphosphatase